MNLSPYFYNNTVLKYTEKLLTLSEVKKENTNFINLSSNLYFSQCKPFKKTRNSLKFCSLVFPDKDIPNVAISETCSKQRSLPFFTIKNGTEKNRTIRSSLSLCNFITLRIKNVFPFLHFCSEFFGLFIQQNIICQSCTSTRYALINNKLIFNDIIRFQTNFHNFHNGTFYA